MHTQTCSTDGFAAEGGEAITPARTRALDYSRTASSIRGCNLNGVMHSCGGTPMSSGRGLPRRRDQRLRLPTRGANTLVSRPARAPHRATSGPDAHIHRGQKSTRTQPRHEHNHYCQMHRPHMCENKHHRPISTHTAVRGAHAQSTLTCNHDTGPDTSTRSWPWHCHSAPPRSSASAA